MIHTYYLGIKSFKTVLRLNIFLGILLMLNGTTFLLRNDPDPFYYSIGILMEVAGGGYIVYALFFAQGKNAPRIEINDSFILVKTGFLKSKKIFDWEKIKEIEFSNYKITLHLQKGMENICYECAPETSITIKEKIREMAILKDIPNSGG